MGSDDVELTGAAAREARKKRLEESGAALSGADARRARKEKAEEAKRLADDAEAARLQKRKEKRGSTGADPAAEAKKDTKPDEGADPMDKDKINEKNDEVTDPLDDEARRKKIAEKVAARRVAMEKEKAVADAKKEEEAKAAADAKKEEDKKDKVDLPDALVDKLLNSKDLPGDKKEADKDASSSDSSSEKRKKAKDKVDNLKKGFCALLPSEIAAMKQQMKEAKKAKKKEKKAKTNKTTDKKKKKKKSSSSSSRSLSPAALAMAKTMYMQETSCFAWERDNTQAKSQVIIAGFGATNEEVEEFLAECGRLDPDCAQRFRDMPGPLQKLCIDAGNIGNSRNPSSVLMGRARDAEMGKLGAPGQAKAPPNPKIEKMIAMHKLDPNCIARLRNLSPLHQKIALEQSWWKDLGDASNPSGLIMSKLEPFRQSEARATVAFR